MSREGSRTSISLRRQIWLASFVLAAIALFVAASWVAAQRELTSLESLFLQWLVLVVGLIATVFTGYQSLRHAAAESTRQHARSAFRRVTALYAGYTRIGASITAQRERLAGETETDGRIRIEEAGHSLNLLETQLNEQYETLQDALDDWRDLSPEGVAEIEAQLGKRLEQ